MVFILETYGFLLNNLWFSGDFAQSIKGKRGKKAQNIGKIGVNIPRKTK